MIVEHFYTVMINEVVKHSTDDYTFFISLLFQEFVNLQKQVDAKEFKNFSWTVYRSSDDRILVHFVCL